VTTPIQNRRYKTGRMQNFFPTAPSYLTHDVTYNSGAADMPVGLLLRNGLISHSNTYCHIYMYFYPFIFPLWIMIRFKLSSDVKVTDFYNITLYQQMHNLRIGLPYWNNRTNMMKWKIQVKQSNSTGMVMEWWYEHTNAVFVNLSGIIMGHFTRPLRLYRLPPPQNYF
jgi:hypothetical protein